MLLIRNITYMRLGRRTMISIALIAVLTVSSLFVGSSLQNKSSSSYREGETTLTVDRGAADAVTAASQAAEAASAASDSAKSASGNPLSVLFSIVELNNEVDIEAYSDVYERMVVYTARISMTVDDIDATLDQVKQITAIYGGFVSTVNTRDERGSITIRVPQSKFHEAIENLEVLGEVNSRDLQGEDVTEEYVDLGAQLTALEAQESRYLEILEMGNTVDDVLKVERELKNVREEIERIQGRINYLDSRVELSTITLNLSLKEEPVKVVQAWFPDVDWGVPVKTGLAVLFTITQGMVTMTIVIGPFIMVGYGLVRGYRWYRFSRASVQDEETVPL
jgi:hypothetical protein